MQSLPDQMLGGEQWKTNVIMTSFLIPGIIFAIFFILNLVCMLVNASSPVNVALIGQHNGLKYLPLDSRIYAGPTADSHPVTVYNKVTNGALTMREDVPAYLSNKAQNFCALDGCEIAGTDMGTGTELTATCQTEAEITTNGDNSPMRWVAFGVALKSQAWVQRPS